jgi:hypothetical protein
VGYHYYRVQWYLVQLLVAATVDTAASAARASTDTLGRVADSLLREIMALMEVIGNFVDQLGDSIMELAMSRGVGKTFKDLVVFLCQVIEVVHNTLWVHVLCPLLQIAMSAAEFMIDVLDTLLDIVRILSMGAASKALDLFIAVCRQVIRGVTRALGDCESRQFNCVLEPVFGTQDSDVGALPNSSCRARRQTRASSRLSRRFRSAVCVPLVLSRPTPVCRTLPAMRSQASAPAECRE